MTLWQRYRRLNQNERRALHHSLLALPVISLGLHLTSFRRWQRALSHLSPAPPPQALPTSDSEWGPARTVARMVDAAGRHVWPHTRCLERSLTAWWLLRWKGLPVNLRIGVRKNNGILQAHAWLEISGVVLNDTAEIYRGYTAFERAIDSTRRSAAPLQPPA